MTSQLELLIQQAIQLAPDERIELITHLANSLRSTEDLANDVVLTATQRSQLERLKAEVERGLEQARTGNMVDGETVVASLRQRIDRYREIKYC